MVWTTITAVYGYAIDITTLDNEEDFLDEDGFIDHQTLCDLLIYIKPNLDCTPSSNVIDESSDYSIPEFEHYVDKSKFPYYHLLHTFSCCSSSTQTHVIIGVTYDEMDRNLFLDKTFDAICDKVFNHPTKIEDICDSFFQHDSRDFISPRDSKYGKYTADIHSEPGVRKRELMTPNQSIKTFVNSFKSHYSFLGEPACYLMLDDCISCT